MIDLASYRVIDLSPRLVPGEAKIDGRYLHGQVWENRPIELKEFIAYNARMHFIQGQTHCGVHCEAPYKYFDDGKDLSDLALESFMGEAAVIKFTAKRGNQKIEPDDLKSWKIRSRDIVLAWAPPPSQGENYSYITDDAVDYLASLKVKSVGLENLSLLVPGRKPKMPLASNQPDARLLERSVGLIDGLVNLDKLRKPRVFFIALPIKLARVTAFWTRAVALEEK